MTQHVKKPQKPWRARVRVRARVGELHAWLWHSLLTLVPPSILPETIEKIRARTKVAMESPEVQRKIEAWVESRVGSEMPSDIKERISGTLRKKLEKKKVGRKWAVLRPDSTSALVR